MDMKAQRQRTGFPVRETSCWCFETHATRRDCEQILQEGPSRVEESLERCSPYGFSNDAPRRSLAKEAEIRQVYKTTQNQQRMLQPSAEAP